MGLRRRLVYKSRFYSLFRNEPSDSEIYPLLNIFYTGNYRCIARQELSIVKTASELTIKTEHNDCYYIPVHQWLRYQFLLVSIANQLHHFPLLSKCFARFYGFNYTSCWFLIKSYISYTMLHQKYKERKVWNLNIGNTLYTVRSRPEFLKVDKLAGW